MKKRSIILGTVVGGALVIGAGAWGMTQTNRFQEWKLNRERAELPAPVGVNEFTDITVGDASLNAEPTTQNANTVAEPETEIPAELNLSIPFTSQAPHGNWDAAHEEYCEEASLLMANRYLNGRGIDGPDDAEAAMDEIANWEVDRFGYFESTTAEETATVAREYLGLQAKTVTDFSWEDVKRELAQGHMVILPAAGRELGNPFFTSPGPLYHMLVVKGWTESKIITNDPGTRRGADYVYDPEVLYAAVGDWNNGDPPHGDKVMIVVWK